MDRLRAIVSNPLTERVVIALIVVNAITLGLETSKTVMESVGPLLIVLDKIILAVFVVEITARIAVHRLAFFRDPGACSTSSSWSSPSCRRRARFRSSARSASCACCGS